MIYSELYREFADKFEKYLEGFCEEKGITHAEFMKKAREASAEDEKAKHYLNILLSSAEYETFVKLMRIMRPAAEAKLLKQEAKEGNDGGDKLANSRASATSTSSEDKGDGEDSARSEEKDGPVERDSK